MNRDYSRREFVSLLGSAAASALAACGGATDPTESEPSEPDQQTGPATYVVEKQGDTVEARVQSSDAVVASGTNARRIIQAALDEVELGGVVHIKGGTYITDAERIRIKTDEVEVKGDGVGNTILKMAAGINEKARPIVALQEGTTQSTLRDIEINGNESENRDIARYPDSPPGHGLIVNGERNTVEDVYVHDTIRSNIVVNGERCELSSLRLKNSTTDHWLYITDGDNCTVEDVHASGFSRTGGIVFGVGERTCRNNTVSNVTIEKADTTPAYEKDQVEFQNLGQYYPLQAITYRSGPNVSNNTVEDITIRTPQHEAGHTIHMLHPGATLRALTYEGPVGLFPEFLTIGTRKGGAPGAVVDDVTIRVTDTVDRGANITPVIESHSSDATLQAVDIHNALGSNVRGIAFDGEHRPVDSNLAKDVRIESGGHAVIADGRDNGVTELALRNVTDVRCSGIETEGEVSFAEKDVTCP